LSALARMGLDPKVIHDYDQLLSREPDPELYPIDAITSLHHWMGKEHFLSFRDRHAPQYHSLVASRLFFAVTSERNRGIPSTSVVDRSRTPLGPGMPEQYMSGTAHLRPRDLRAIRVSSFLVAAEDLHHPFSGPRRGVGKETLGLAGSMSTFLEERTALVQE
jgi:hypothetical protein